jgi:CubicO group peptidase (beta-lactamase class C family)
MCGSVCVLRIHIKQRHYEPMRNYSPVFDYLRGWVQAGKLPSAVFGVADKTGVLAMDAMGQWPNGDAIRADDAYLLWSVTKPIVGLGFMQLVERGQVNLQQEVKQHLPWFGAGRTDKVLLWHLLTHTAGISEITLSPSMDKREHLTGAGVSFHAGTHKQYSNQAFVAQEEILKSVTGGTLEAHLQQTIFKPLGMAHTSFDTHEQNPDRVVPMMGGDKVPVDMARFLQLKHPAAGLFSTAPDLLTLGQCLLNEGAHSGGHIINKLTLREMVRPQTVGIRSQMPDDWTNDVDFGLTFIRPNYTKSIVHKNTYGHNGWGGCKFWVYPDEGVCFVLMTNLMDPGLHGVDTDILHNMFTACL